MGQKLIFKKLTHDNINENIACKKIIEDEDGDMWFATYHGLYRYNGRHLTGYFHNPIDTGTIHHNLINDFIFCDNILYLAIWGNTNEIDKINVKTGLIKRLNPRNKRLDAYSSIFRLSDSDIILGGSLGLILFNTKNLTSSFYDKPFSTILYTEHNKNVFSASGRNIYKYSLEHNKIVLTDSLSCKGNVNCTEIVEKDRLFGTSNGLISLNPKVKIPLSLRSLHVSCLKYYKNILWIGSADRGLYSWDILNDNIIHYPSSKIIGSLQSETINSLYINKSEVLWVGTGAGIYYSNIKKNQFKSIEYKPGMKPWITTPMSLDKSGNLMICDAESLIFYNFINNKYLGNNINLPLVTSIVHDKSKNNYWFGSNNDGMYHFKSDKLNNLKFLKHYTVEKNTELKSNKIISLYYDEDDKTLWIGYYDKGVSTLTEKSEWYHYTQEETKGIAISTIFKASDKKIWIGKLDNGFMAAEKNKNNKYEFKHFTKENKNLCYNTITFLTEDSEHNIWLGTFGGGVMHYNVKTDHIRCFTIKDGLPSNNIVGVLADKYDNIWCSTSDGIGLLYKNSSRFRVFSESDGIQNNYNFYGSYKMPSGELLFGSQKAITIIHPDSVLQKNKTFFRPKISLIRLFNKVIEPGDSHLASYAQYADEVTFTYFEDLLTFEFSNNNYLNPEKVIYSYKLEGFDHDWNDLGTSNKAVFTRLPADNYKLNVRSSTDGGYSYQYIKKPLTINILPIWYQTWWFRMVMLFTGMAIVWYLIQLRTKRLLNIQRVEIEKQAALDIERTRIARDMHDDLGSGLSAIHLLSNFLKNSDLEPIVHNQIEKIANSSTELNQKLREIVWSMNPGHDYVQNLADFIRRYVTDLSAIHKNVELSFQTINGLPDINIPKMTQKEIFLCVKEAIHNSLKHSGAKSIYTTLQVSEDELKVVVSDDGKGFDTESAHHRGGQGLQNIEERMKSIHGKVHYQMLNGCRMELTMPLR